MMECFELKQQCQLCCYDSLSLKDDGWTGEVFFESLEQNTRSVRHGRTDNLI